MPTLANDFPLFQKDDEKDDDFKLRIFTTVSTWVPLAQDTDIPRSGPVYSVWRNMQTIHELTDDELSEDYFETLQNNDLYSSSWWGVTCRMWRDLLKIEIERRRDAHN